MIAREVTFDLLAAGESKARMAADVADRDQLWPAIESTARDWNVAPALLGRIKELGIRSAETTRRALALEQRSGFISSSMLASRSVKAARYLEENGVPVVIFKGLASIVHLYRGPEDRLLRDIDVLIRPADLEPAMRILEARGLRPQDGGSLSGYAASVRNLPGFAGNESIDVVGDDFEAMDVHWSLGPRPTEPMRVEQLMSRAVSKSISGLEVSVVCPKDGLVLSAHHAMRESFSPDGMMRDLLDTARWITLLEREGQWQEALEHARDCRLAPAVYALGSIAGKPDNVAALRSPEGERLAELFWIQLRDGAFTKDMVNLVDPRAWWKVVRGTLGGWRSYRTSAAIFETKATGAQVSIRGRLRGVAKRMTGLDIKRWRALRNLARARARYQSV